MKRAIALALAVSAFSAASAYAVPQQPSMIANTAPASAPAAKVVASQAQPAAKDKAVLVADNRKEFGSQYQRY